MQTYDPALGASFTMWGEAVALVFPGSQVVGVMLFVGGAVCMALGTGKLSLVDEPEKWLGGLQVSEEGVERVRDAFPQSS